ncbi:sigma-70 family RNA polymerase sigma factor [Candidatus Woesearchaeota archaeon]|nr:sigma-70 family RNA polymerase sigma factor [Candidatus Woesearchaeota archaeon]
MSDAFFDRLYRVYRPVVYRLARRMVGPDDAEDVVQDVFFKAFRRLDTYHGGNEQTWLCTITKHRCIDLLRRRQRWSRMHAVWEYSMDDFPAQLDQTSTQKEELIELATGFFPGTSKDMIPLFLQGYSLCEISEILGVSRSSPRYWLKRARKRAQSYRRAS